MTKLIKKQQKRGVGRPSKYKTEFNNQAYKLALLGATDAEIAEFFEISESTLNEWKIDFPKFSESIQGGKIKADSAVAHKLYDRAMGAEWLEQQAFKVRNQTASGQFTEDVKIVDVKRSAPPDTQAISLWLRNRKADKWKDKVDVNHGGSVTLEQLVAAAHEPPSSN